MKIKELKDLLQAECDKENGDAEIRIGDAIESGPYLHASLGGVWKSLEGSLILCANDDEVWHVEEVQSSEEDLQVLYYPPRQEETA